MNVQFRYGFDLLKNVYDSGSESLVLTLHICKIRKTIDHFFTIMKKYY